MAPRTQPFSVRLSREADLLVADEMRRTGRSRSAVVEELAEEAAKLRLFPGIVFRGRPRRAAINGGLDVWEVVEIYRDYDGDVKRMVRDYESLTERATRIALAYAERFPEEIEESLRLNRRPVDELRALYPFIRFGIDER